MGYRHQLALLAGVALTTLAAPCAQAETLVYKDVNKWVAQEENAPLQRLMQAARSGKHVYKVKLPDENRELAVVRLEIVLKILEREAGKPIVFEETGKARTGTLVIE
ncbi:MAG: hypothetical protein EON60_03125 [Alphaproteobacteria bacterium]|nr:MAG: hypothetical protein EON60_03125 [Alphaproteobacteria bacterium]